MARQYLSRFECGHPGCKEFATYESSRRADQADQYRRYGNKQWRCVRHSQPDEVLALDNQRLVRDVACREHFYEGNSIGLFWGGGSGFAHGPGFKAFAKDFPAGTILRVTAEIIAPPAESDSLGPQGTEGEGA